jgi:hypothetical protein
MKTLVIAGLLFCTGMIHAQLGVVTIKDDGGGPPIGQWYRTEPENEANTIYYFNDIEDVDSVLTKLIEPWEVTLKDSIINEEGNPAWYLDNMNGYVVNVVRIASDDYLKGYIIIKVFEDEGEETTEE